MHRIHWWMIGSMVGLLLNGCTGKITDEDYSGEENPGSKHEFVVRVPPEEHVDSAQLFFFRSLGDRDTLIYRQTFYGIEYLKPKDYYLELPAGKYTVYIWGNFPSKDLVATPPFSPEDFFLDYSDGQEPPDLYFGINYLNVGIDTLNLSGMSLVTSSVSLTIEKVPEGVGRIRVFLTNTAAGVYINRHLATYAANPPLTHHLMDVQADSSYLVHFSCFTGVGIPGESSLNVECYDAGNRLIYSGQSAPFVAHYGLNYTLSCSFSAVTSKASLPYKVDIKRKS